MARRSHQEQAERIRGGVSSSRPQSGIGACAAARYSLQVLCVSPEIVFPWEEVDQLLKRRPTQLGITIADWVAAHRRSF
ncbi:hypothetical protein KR51_00009720 [Rubidibacter lacunae KORDI 51-2]|uniref:Uncharacterized protein n=1 Tax=Rubidibacter lacunae KORDI 51-2 TaxID=582515 RepID=U5DP22_9CHRO|nr:hypothetical protein KR51_00009720 [Rubidibacter lacunae KORDI 51-2]